ncbi:MAG: family 16 glycoside hydrolase [Candidatus Sulfotelmatobacter sp.]
MDCANIQPGQLSENSPYVTVFFNGVLVQNHFELKGETRYIGQPSYKKYDTAPIKLQAHGDHSEPVSFPNIWIRELN